MMHGNAVPTRSFPKDFSGLVALVGPELIAACKKEFKNRYVDPGYYLENSEEILERMLKAESAAGGDDNVLKAFSSVVAIATRRRDLELQQIHVNNARAEIRRWESSAPDEFTPSQLGEEAFRLTPYTDRGADAIPQSASGLSKEEMNIAKALKPQNLYQAGVMQIRGNGITTPLTAHPTVGYKDKVDDATAQVRSMISANVEAMNEILLQKKIGKSADRVNSLEALESLVNKGPTKTRIALNTATEVLSAMAGPLTRGIVTQSNVANDPRLERQRQLNREQAEVLWNTIRGRLKSSDTKGVSESFRRVAYAGDRVLYPEEFESIFKDQLQSMRDAEKNQDKLTQASIKAFEEAVVGINKKAYSSIEKAGEEEDSMVKYRILQALLLVAPFVGLPIFGSALNFFGPMMNMPMADAAGYMTAHGVPIFGDIAEFIHLDDFVTLVLDNFPIVSDLLDLISSITQSGLAQNFSGLLGPILSSPLPEILLGVGYSISRFGTEFEHYDKIGKDVKKAREDLNIAYNGIVPELGKREALSEAAIAEAKVVASEMIYKKSAVGEMLSRLIAGINDVEDFADKSVAQDAVKLQRVRNLMMAIYGTGDDAEAQAKKVMGYMGFEFNKKAPYNIKSFKKAVVAGTIEVDESAIMGGLKQGDLGPLFAFVYFVDRRMVQDEVAASGGVFADEAAKQQAITNKYQELHKRPPQNMHNDRLKFVGHEAMTDRLDEIKTQFETMDKLKMASEGENMLAHQYYRRAALELRFGRDVTESDKLPRADATASLRAKVLSSALGVANVAASSPMMSCKASAGKPMAASMLSSGLPIS